MDMEKLKERKKDLNLTNEELAKLSGVPLSTVQKVMGNTTKSPRKDTYDALKKVLMPEKTYHLERSAGMVCEEAQALKTPMKKPGEYTIEDYYAWPEDQRVELIDGVIYDMGAPLFRHQDIAGNVYYQLYGGIEEYGSDCLVGISPLDVQLDCDNKTMLQPDVIILCDQEKNIDKCVYGAPDFVLEVLSPSSRSRDQIIKLNKYHDAHVREYWIVDPEKERILVYIFEKEDWPDIYTFNDKVPLYVSGNKIEVDFSKIKARMDKYFPKNVD